jgi:murein DD-endopeptidase MepM/ murein hydrolase activator NlpD
VRAPLIFCSCLLLAVAACAPPFQPTPHERYERSLRRAGLDRTALGRDWLAAAQRSLVEALPAALPMQLDLEIPAHEAWARAYRLSLRRGQRLKVRASLAGGDSAQVFIDLFEAAAVVNESPRRLAGAGAESLQLEHEAERDGAVVLRLQCELLRGPRIVVAAEIEPSLAFPVEGRDQRAVISFFGDSRGARRHQGIDIAAPRGTPALSATRGIVTSAGTNNLGGNVVWVLDLERRVVLYYAHLDQHVARAGDRVVPGDTLGLVGNTGNAERTVPHLHFGIYVPGEGAVDPYPFVARPAVRGDRRGEAISGWLESLGAVLPRRRD